METVGWDTSCRPAIVDGHLGFLVGRLANGSAGYICKTGCRKQSENRSSTSTLLRNVLLPVYSEPGMPLLSGAPDSAPVARPYLLRIGGIL